VAPLDVLFRDSPEQDEDEVDTVLQPDALVVCDATKVKRNGIHGAPDWVLQILSPATAWRDQTVKRALYERHGVKEYWVLNPDTLDLTIFRLVDGTFATPQGASLKEPVAVRMFGGLTLSLPS
jgi:Uma2 family endonuclease